MLRALSLALTVCIFSQVVLAEDNIRITSCAGANDGLVKRLFNDSRFVVDFVPSQVAATKIGNQIAADDLPDFIVNCPIGVVQDFFSDTQWLQEWPDSTTSIYQPGLIGADRKWITTSIDVGSICLNSLFLKDTIGTNNVSIAKLFALPQDGTTSSTAPQPFSMQEPLSSWDGYSWWILILERLGVNRFTDIARALSSRSHVFVPAPCEQVVAGNASFGLTSWLAYRSLPASHDVSISLPTDGTWVWPFVALATKNASSEKVVEVSGILAGLINDPALRAELASPPLDIVPIPQGPTVALPHGGAPEVPWTIAPALRESQSSELKSIAEEGLTTATIATSSSTSCPVLCSKKTCQKDACYFCSFCSQ